jgi:hypothetical protein
MLNETLGYNPDLSSELDEQQQLLLFVASMDAASVSAISHHASRDELAAVYEYYGAQVHMFVNEDYDAGMQLFANAMDYLRLHDCSTEAIMQLQDVYSRNYNSDERHDHATAHRGLHGENNGLENKNKKKDKKDQKKHWEWLLKLWAKKA